MSTTGSDDSDSEPFPGDVDPSLRCTAAAIRGAARKVTQHYDDRLKPTGLRLSQFSVLRNVARRDGATITELAELLTMDRTTLTRNLRPLESAGLLRLETGGDRRSRAVRITDAGRAMLDRSIPLWEQAERDLRARVGEQGAREVRDLMRGLVTAIGG